MVAFSADKEIFSMAAEFSSEVLWGNIERLRNAEPSPLVHCIMNTVAQNDCANALLAVGAKPCMAQSPAESREITSQAAALVINMGTLSEDRKNAMFSSGVAANKAGIPCILDPVGVKGSEYRRLTFEALLGRVKFTVIKGNLNEMSYVAQCYSNDPQETALLAARGTNSVGVVTGECDYISDGMCTYRIENGTPLLSKVTGTGCMTGALIGAFSTVTDGLTAALCGVSLMDICGEIAAEGFCGTGTFRVKLMDMMSQISREQIIGRLKADKIWEVKL